MIIDHVAILVSDAAETARKLRERYGLGSERGAYLPLAGTPMHTVWLEPPQYLEFHTIENRLVAATTESGRITLAREAAGGLGGFERCPVRPVYVPLSYARLA